MDKNDDIDTTVAKPNQVTGGLNTNGTAVCGELSAEKHSLTS